MSIVRSLPTVAAVALLWGAASPAFAQLTPSTLPNPQVGVPYSQTITAGFPAFGFTVSSGSLPTGLTLVGAGGSGTLSGTPTVPGPYSFTIRADGLGGGGPMGPMPVSASQSYGVTVAAAPATIPTMSEWAMIGMGLALAGMAASVVMTRRRTLSS